MRRASRLIVVAAALLAVSAAARAQNAYTSRPANVRAGPDRTYPLVVQLAPGTPVQVNGCLDDWSWCDVGFADSRGWVYAPSLSYVYEGSRVPLYSYAPSLGIPIVTFSLGAYWDRWYRGRPWFAQRNMWAHRHIPHRPPPGPRPHAGPPPRPGMGPRPGPPHAGPPGARAEFRGAPRGGPGGPRAAPRGGEGPGGPRGGPPSDRARGGPPSGRAGGGPPSDRGRGGAPSNRGRGGPQPDRGRSGGGDQPGPRDEPH